MSDALLWGLVQGLTEFLPVSSSGHLVLVPELLGREPPSLATSAVLHLGTLLALLVYFRAEVAEVLRLTPHGRVLLRWLAIGTIPAAVIGFTLGGQIEKLEDEATFVAVMLMVTGLALLSTRFITIGERRIDDSTIKDPILLGIGQAFALIPGLSRSGFTMVPGMQRGFTRTEAARYAFLLGIPAIAGAGVLQFIELSGTDAGVPAELWAGVAVAAVSGYASIAFLLRLLRRAGLTPFGVYCVFAGLVALLVV